MCPRRKRKEGNNMEEFYQALVISIGILITLGSSCAFMFSIFHMMKKQIDLKMDLTIHEIHRITDELREDRRSKDYLYKLVIDYVEKRKNS